MSAAQLEEAALRFALAARLTSYPDARFAPAVAQLVASGLGEVPASLVGLTRSEAELDTARAEYVGLFDHGEGRTPLYETEYGRMRGMSKGTELADINGFYQAFGLLPGDADAEREMGDHLGVELEFYAVLLARQAHLLEAGDPEGVEVVEDARRKFLVDHLGRFAPAIAQRDNVVRSAIYGPVFTWAQGLVAAQCDALGVVPAALDFHSLEPAPDSDACCGATNQLTALSPQKEEHP